MHTDRHRLAKEYAYVYISDLPDFAKVMTCIQSPIPRLRVTFSAASIKGAMATGILRVHRAAYGSV